MKSKTAAISSMLAGTLLLATGVFAGPTVHPTGVTIHEEGVADGYIVFDAAEIQYLIDVHGNEVHRWDSPCSTYGPARPVANGHILIASCGSALVEMDWDSNFVWEFAPPPGANFHHDWERLSNGNTLILAHQNIVVPSISPVMISEDFLLEVSPEGDIVWEWYISDHFDEFGFSQERIDNIYELGGDWSHVNTASSIPVNTSHSDPRFSPGNVIISVRHQNTVAIIDHATGQIVWVLTDVTLGQHDTHMLPDDVPGGGNILLFDNGSGGWPWVTNRYHSSVAEIDPVTKTFPFLYTADDSGLPTETFYSPLTSGAQRLPNGNTIILESKWGRVFEITPTGQIVWEYISPYGTDAASDSNHFYRAYKVPLEWAGPYFEPDLAISMAGNPDPVQLGQELHYDIQVENVGSEPAVSPEVVQPTPVGTTFESVSAPVGWNCSTPAVGGTGSITCTGSELSAGEAANLTIVVNPDLCHVDGADITNTANVSSMGTDANLGDNAATVVTPGASDALVSDLTVALTNGGSDLQLDWGDRAPACGYHVLRSTAPDGSYMDASGLLSGNTYTDSGVGSPGEDYYYLIRVD